MLGVEEQYVLGFKPVDFEKDPQKFEEKKRTQNSRKNKKVKVQKNLSESDDSNDEYNSEEEEEEGQLQIPEDVVRDIDSLIPNQFYLVCYIRQKTEEEQEIEYQV